MEGTMANYTKIIEKALGKRRMAKIIEVDTYGMLMVDIVMKEGWFYDGSNTCVFAEWAPEQEQETWSEFLKFLKNCVDDFEYKPELEKSYKTLPPKKETTDPFEGIVFPTETNDYDETPCGDPHCHFCGEPHDEMEVA